MTFFSSRGSFSSMATRISSSNTVIFSWAAVRSSVRNSFMSGSSTPSSSRASASSAAAMASAYSKASRCGSLSTEWARETSA